MSCRCPVTGSAESAPSPVHTDECAIRTRLAAVRAAQSRLNHAEWAAVTELRTLELNVSDPTLRASYDRYLDETLALLGGAR